MPDPGPNEQSLELPEVSPSPPLTVARAPAPLVVPGGWRIEGLPGPSGRLAPPPSGAYSNSSQGSTHIRVEIQHAANTRQAYTRALNRLDEALAAYLFGLFEAGRSPATGGAGGGGRQFPLQAPGPAVSGRPSHRSSPGRLPSRRERAGPGAGRARPMGAGRGRRPRRGRHPEGTARVRTRVFRAGRFPQ